MYLGVQMENGRINILRFLLSLGCTVVSYFQRICTVQWSCSAYVESVTFLLYASSLTGQNRHSSCDQIAYEKLLNPVRLNNDHVLVHAILLSCIWELHQPRRQGKNKRKTRKQKQHERQS